ncbi:MAG: hypothetical protein Q9221_007612 [Calogaya cf. arnoldii]
MARLEDLPSELLNMIFILSLFNLSLPRASRHIGAALNKIALVTLAFSGNPSHRLGFAGDQSTREARVRELQSDILSCRWMTWDFIKVYFEAFITKSILSEFGMRASKLRWYDGKPARTAAVQSYVHDVVYQNLKVGIDPRDEETLVDYTDFDDAGENIVNFLYIGPEGWERGCNIITSTLVARSWILDNGPSAVTLVVSPRMGVVLTGLLSTCPESNAVIWGALPKRFKALECSAGPCQIPAKLLIGPWTDEKLHLLEALLEAGAELVDDDHRDLAEQGLMDAIKQDNHRAVDLLAARSNGDPYNLEEIWIEPSVRDMGLGMHNPSMDGVSSYCNVLQRRRTCKVRPTTKHIQRAVIEGACRKTIVRRLLFVRSARIDRNDKSILKWISMKRRVGDKKGEWLENNLQRRTEWSLPDAPEAPFDLVLSGHQ